MARAELTTCDSYAKAFPAHNIISLNSSDDERPPQDEVIRKSLQRQQHGLKGEGCAADCASLTHGRKGAECCA